MTPLELLLVCSLSIVALSPLLFLTVYLLRDQQKTRTLLENLLRLESSRVQTLLNLATTRDFQTFAGLQSLTSQSQPQSRIQSPTFSSGEEYIPRDDVTEAMRMKAFGAPGYGETVFDEETTDEELKQAIIEMVASGQIDFGEEV